MVSTAAPPPPRKRRSFLWQAAAASLMVFVGMGSASAAVMLWKRVVQPEPVVTQLPVEKPRAKKPRHEKPVEPLVEAQVEEPVVAPVVESEKPEKRKPARKPEDFLDDANGLRAEKRWREADENYARVWQVAPKSSAAYVARVASAAVRLEHLHDAKTALARYRAALEQNPRGALSEEIRFGIAECYRARGNHAEERKALESFVHDHPGSGLASKARARLQEL
jgi:tetratricopeptide (TPR) repeat protein